MTTHVKISRPFIPDPNRSLPAWSGPQHSPQTSSQPQYQSAISTAPKDIISRRIYDDGRTRYEDIKYRTRYEDGSLSSIVQEVKVELGPVENAPGANYARGAQTGMIAGIQWLMTADGRPATAHNSKNLVEVMSIAGLSLDRKSYNEGASNHDLEGNYHYLTTLYNGNTVINGSKYGDEGIEVGEGGKATIDSGAGNDVVWVWHKKNIVLDGGSGNDTLRFEYQFGFANQPAQGAVIDLAAGTGTNPFGGTIKVKNVENVVGQSGAANDLRGDGHANHLQGGTLADTLMGRGGNDEIHVKYGTSLDPRATLADGGQGRDTLVAELSDSSAAPFTGSGETLRFINRLDLENPADNTGTFHGGTFENFEIIKASSSGPYYVFDFHGSEKGESVYASTSEDTVDGRGGDDVIFGGFAGDEMTGGGGADRFWFRYATDSNAAGEDTVTDFKHAEHDRIDLAKIYGPRLDFIGTDKFHGHAGELHAVKQGGDTLVEADTNGDKAADFALLLHGGPKLAEGDFIL